MNSNKCFNWLKKKNLIIVLFSQVIQSLMWIIGQAIYRYWFRLRCLGKENLPKTGPYLIAANHTSHLDGPAIIAALGKHPNHVYSLAAKDYFFNHPFKGWLCKTFLNLISFERQRKIFTFNCLPECHQLIEQKKIILVFPEGTRSVNGQLQAFKPGVGLLAMQLNVPIVPVYVHGTYHALAKGQHFPKKYPISVSFGVPLDITLYQTWEATVNNHKFYQKIVDDVRAAVVELREQYDNNDEVK